MALTAMSKPRSKETVLGEPEALASGAQQRITTVTRRGTAFEKVELKADWESKNSREPKCDKLEAAEKVRTADTQGERVGWAGAAAAVQRTMN